MRASGQKNLGIVLNKTDVEPVSDSDRDIQAFYDEIHNLWFDDAIFRGRYPDLLLSKFEKYLPKDIKMI